jgi:hypothetical protein
MHKVDHVDDFTIVGVNISFVPFPCFLVSNLDNVGKNDMVRILGKVLG